MYTIIADVQRTVVEQYVCKVSAGSLEEALDVVYEVLTDYPDSSLRLDTLRRESEDTVSTEVLYIGHDHSAGSANDGNEVA